jgi:hypothetical protein
LSPTATAGKNKKKKKDAGKKNVGAPLNVTGETNCYFRLIILKFPRTLLKDCRRLFKYSCKQKIQIRGNLYHPRKD